MYICSKYWLDETRVSLATMSRKPVLAWNLHSTQLFFDNVHQHRVREDRKNLIFQIPPSAGQSQTTGGLGNLYITCLHWNICLQYIYIYTWATHERSIIHLTFKNKVTGTKHINWFFLLVFKQVYNQRLMYKIKLIISNQERFTRGHQKVCGLTP